MVISCQFANPLTEPRWNKWISEFPEAGVFHGEQWARILAECYGYSLHHAVFRQGSEIVGIVPIAEVRSLVTGCRAVSLPFSDTCPPLLRYPGTFREIIEPLAARGRDRRWDYLELRGGPVSELPEAVLSDEFFTHDLIMEASTAEQFAKLKDTHRRNIQKARKLNLESQTLYGGDAMRAYYSLHCITRRRHGLPPQPSRFFDWIQRVLLKPKDGFVQLVKYRDKWIAGAVFLKFGRNSTYKFGASDLAYQHLRPNNLLMWDAIERLRQEGSHQLSFGRTALQDAGLLQFKRGWGTTESVVQYSKIGLGKAVAVPTGNSRRAASAGMEIARHLPIPMLRLLGGIVYKHVG